jgi:hypothetical protein
LLMAHDCLSRLSIATARAIPRGPAATFATLLYLLPFSSPAIVSATRASERGARERASERACSDVSFFAMADRHSPFSVPLLSSTLCPLLRSHLLPHCWRDTSRMEN